MTLVDRGPGSSRLDPGAFTRLAAFLDRAADDGDRRIAARQAVLDDLDHQRAALRGAWISPASAAAGEELGRFVTSARGAEPTVTGAFHALRGLAGEARRIAATIAEVEQYEKSWNEQLVTNWSEWQDRTTTAVAAHLPGGNGPRSEELTRWYQERTRRTEEASRRRADALRLWHSLCSMVGQALDEARDLLDRLATTAPRLLATPDGPTGAARARLDAWRLLLRAALGPPGAAPDARRVDRVLGQVPPGALGALVGGLTDEELDRLLAAVPDVTRRPLLRALGEQRAREVHGALADAGVDPDRFDPADLAGLDPSSPAAGRLVAVLDQVRHRRDGAFAGGFFGNLGVEGTRALLGALERLLSGGPLPVPTAGAPAITGTERLAIDVIDMFATSTRDPATTELRRRLLSPTEPWHHRQLALLLSGDPAAYEPGFAAAAATNLLVEHQGAASTYPLDPTDGGRHPTAPLWTDPWRRSADAIALRALAGSPDAAAAFVSDAGGPREANIDALVHASGQDPTCFDLPIPADVSNDQLAGVGRSMEDDATSALATVLTPGRPPLLDHARATAVYAHIVRDLAARPDTTVTAGTKQVLGGALVAYLPDIGRQAREQTARVEALTEDEAATLPFTRPDLVGFLAVVAADAGGAGRIGESVTAWALHQTAGYVDHPADWAQNDDDLRTVTAVMGAVEDGLQLAGENHGEAYAGYTWGVDSTINLVTDDIIGAIPAVGDIATAIAKRLPQNWPGGRIVMHRLG